MSSPPFFRNSQNLPVARPPFQRPVAIPKAPILNPYEKFTQPQFDAWIGNITGALRDALGYQAELPPKSKIRTQWHIPASEDSEVPDATDVTEEDTDADLDDSFAEVKARRATSANAKGKGRDPREGPGLGGKGDRNAPIEIDLDSEEEEQEEDYDQEGDEWDEEEDEQELGTSDEEEEEAIRNGESSARAHARYQKYAEQYEDGVEDEEEEDGDEERDEMSPDAIEVISDDEPEEATVLQPEDDEVSSAEYSDEENENPTSLLIGPPKRTHTAEHDYSDQGEETGSESENEEASSPPRPAGDEDIFEEEDELDDRLSLHQPQRGEPEIIELGSDEEEAAQADEDFVLEGDEDAQAKEEDFYAPLRSSAHPNEQDYQYDDDVLPGSSPILSSPIEPEQHSFQHALEDFSEQDLHKTHNPLETFDWNHPPAFSHGLPASGPGHLATPVEDDNVANSDEYLQPEMFGTSDQLPTFESASRMQTESEAEPMQSDEGAQNIESVSEPEYFVAEAEEREQDLDVDDADVRSVSRGVSADPHHFTVEESFTDYEFDDRAMSIDVVTVDEEMVGRDVEELEASSVHELGVIDKTVPGEGESTADILGEQSAVDEAPEDASTEISSLDPHTSGELEGHTPVAEPVQQGEETDIPMPISANTIAYDASPDLEDADESAQPVHIVEAMDVSANVVSGTQFL
ncbi:hypothetical protein B0H12DRAFT_811820 [Mycena haematopus]|nr:hypothetical protein B0H12DRAFT_811820 [Mycena haematopus]